MGRSSQTSKQKTTLGNTTTSNPYVVSKTTNKGTTSSFAKGSGLDTMNTFFNNNIGNLLNDYLNPSLDTTTNKALMNNYVTNLNKTANKSFENNIINPLSNRNMIRSSQATNMYKGLSNNISDNVASYSNELLANSQTNSANMINNLFDAYMKGFNAITTNQNQSLNTSLGNATKTTTQTYNPSVLSNISQGVGIAANAANIVKSFM